MYKRSLEKVTAFLKSKNGIRCVIAVGVLGMLMIVFSELRPTRKTEQKEKVSDTETYVHTLEERLTETVSHIDGVGACRVMVTLENGVKYVYASEEKTGSDYKTEGDALSRADDNEQSVILVQTDDGYEGLLVTELQPTVKGVVVVCEGGGDAAVQERVKTALCAVLNITDKRVCVVAGNGKQ
ncbi:MAG: hypothetical protein E7552_01740 [Ruminococcaceae bacterium]|nr:hypothetical protein [Oscillospiraceae bacterium]